MNETWQSTALPGAPSGTDESGEQRARVVVGVDCSSQSHHVLFEAAQIAGHLDAELEAVFVYLAPSEYTWMMPILVARDEMRAHMYGVLQQIVQDTFGADPPPRLSLWAVAGDPAKMLLARASAAQLLVVGSNGHGEVVNMLLGSVAAKCVEHASGPVLVVHDQDVDDANRTGNEPGPSAGRIIVGVDGSDASKAALAWAARLAEPRGLGIDAVLTWEPPVMFGYNMGYIPVGWTPRSDYEKWLGGYVDDVFSGSRPTDLRLIAEEGSAAYRLIERAVDAALLVVGNRGHGGFHNLLLGSVSAKCANRAACSVLVVHVPPAGQATDLADASADAGADADAEVETDAGAGAATMAAWPGPVAAPLPVGAS